jgi:2-polyprenyl-3-methyl-5-hydroxy-6-metoxy-1,4-benzoquinol methylase
MDDVLYAIYEDLIHRHTNPSTLLEVGCGTAYLSRTLSQSGYTVTAFDTNEKMLTVASYIAGSLNQTITLLKHDITKPFSGAFDTIIMPIDVINHLPNIDAIKHALNHINKALNENGIFIFDMLKTSYFDILKDHEETIPLKDDTVYWRAKAINDHTIEHTVTIDNETATHQEFFYNHTEILDMMHDFTRVETTDLESRIIYVLKKKEE